MAQGGARTFRELVRDRLFMIPDYQRPYAWEEKQLRDLREDLDLMGPSGRHYTGTVVLARGAAHDSSQGSMQEWEVVDGQQRLTTLFLLLSRVLRRLRSIPGDPAATLADELDRDFGPVVVAHAQRPRLHLAGDLKDYWRTAVLEGRSTALLAETTGHRRLRDAVAYFDTWLDELLGREDTAGFDILADLATRVADGLEVLVYETESTADVGVLFESLNDRGRHLTELELIKNYLLYLTRLLDEPTRSELALTVNQAWRKIHENLAAAPSLTEDSVLRAHWLVTQGGDTFEGVRSLKSKYPRSAYTPLHSRLDRHEQPTDGDPLARLYEHLSTYTNTLELCSVFARELHDRDARFVDLPGVRAHALAVNERLRHTSYGLARFFPVLFATRLAHQHDGRLYTDVLDLCEIYVVRIFMLTRWRTHTGRSSLQRLGRRIFTDSLTPDAIRDSLAGLIRYYADDTRVRASLDQPTNWYDLAGHKFLLYEYERHILHAGAALEPWGTFVERRYKETTEHVLPQKPRKGSKWLDDFSDKDERAELTNSLGNLMLTLDNSRYSNKDYAQKRGDKDSPSTSPCYFNGALEQERQLARDFPVWTPDAVRARNASMSDWIVQRWSLPTDAAAVMDEQEIDADTVADEVVALQSPEGETDL